MDGCLIIIIRWEKAAGFNGTSVVRERVIHFDAKT